MADPPPWKPQPSAAVRHLTVLLPVSAIASVWYKSKVWVLGLITREEVGPRNHDGGESGWVDHSHSPRWKPVAPSILFVLSRSQTHATKHEPVFFSKTVRPIIIASQHRARRNASHRRLKFSLCPVIRR